MKYVDMEMINVGNMAKPHLIVIVYEELVTA